MKFLLWQFGAYAAAALVVGVVLGVVWERSTTRLARRRIEHLTRLLAAAEGASERLRAQLAAEGTDLSAAAAAGRELADLRAELALARARSSADRLARVEAERRCEQAVLERTELLDAKARMDLAQAHLVAQADEGARLRTLADAAGAERGVHERIIAELEAQSAGQAAELIELRDRYQSAATAHQTALSTARVEAVEARARAAELAAEVTRLRVGLVPSDALGEARVIDLRGTRPVGTPPVSSSAGTAHADPVGAALVVPSPGGVEVSPAESSGGSWVVP